MRDTLLGRISLEEGEVHLEELGKAADALREAPPRRAPRLRHELARRPRRQVPDRADRRHPGRGRLRQRVPLPDARSSARAPWPSRSARAARRPTPSPRSARRRSKGALGLAICNVQGSMLTREAAGSLLTHAGPGDRRRLDEGVHRPARGALPPRPPPRAAARDARPPRPAASTSPTSRACRTSWSRRSRTERAIEESRADALPRARLPLPRPRRQLPDRPRGRAQAQGDLVRPRRGLPGRRDEARPDRAHRRGAAGRRALPARAASTRRCSRTCRR